MLEKGLAIISESVLKISDDITKMDGFFKKPLCCPPTLLTLPLKMNSTKVHNPRRKIHMQALDAGITPCIVSH